MAVFDTIVCGTRRVVELAARAGVQRFLFVSSGAVYGPSIGHRAFSEDDNSAPLATDSASTYANAKRAAEHICVLEAARSNFCVTIARVFALIGPYMPADAGYAIMDFVLAASRGETIKVRGDGRAIRSYLYASDLAAWLWTILTRGTSGRAYNVGSAQPHSIGETAEIVRQVISLSASVLIQSETAEGLAPSWYVPDTRRADHELQLREQVNLQEAIKRTGAFLRTSHL